MATDVEEAIKALGDPTRRAIFELIASAPLSVGAIAEQLPVSRPAVSQHLKVLKQAGLVIDRAAGTRRFYAVDPDGVDGLRAYFDRFWGTALSGVKKTAEVAAREKEE